MERGSQRRLSHSIASLPFLAHCVGYYRAIAFHRHPPMLLPWAFRAVQTMGLLVGLRVPRSATRFEVIAHPIYAGPVLATPPAQRLPMLHQPFPLVGIGASAGGVEALEVLFQDLS